MSSATAVPMSEAELQDAIVDCARRLGFYAVHFPTSRSSRGAYITAGKYDAKGWLDLQLVSPIQRRTVYVEAKADNGQLTPEQVIWIERLMKAGEEVYVWRPRDWVSGEVETVLGRRAGGGAA